MNEEDDKITIAIKIAQSQGKRVSTESIIIDPKEKQEIDTPEVLDDTWAELAQDWQTQPTLKTDITALVKRTRKRTLGAKVCFALNIIATLALLLVFLSGVYDGQWGEPANVYIGLGSLLSTVFVYFETKIRLTTWSQLCDSPDKAIDNAISSSESAMKYMSMTKVSFLPFLPLINWYVYTVGKTSDKSLLLGFLMVNGFMLMMYFAVEYLYRKRKKEYHHFLSMK
jgi:hypothetical protein